MLSQWFLHALTFIILSISCIKGEVITCGVNSPCDSAINCTNTNCQVICDGEGCKHKTINCKDGTTCNVHCSQASACESATINCPANSSCSVQCDANKSCYLATVKGTTARNLTITNCHDYGKVCFGMTIYCPPFNGGKQCIIDGDNYMGGTTNDPMTLYTINGWDDIQMNAVTKNRYGVMYCKANYDTMCHIQTVNNANDEWQCANTTGKDCDQLTPNPTQSTIYNITQLPTKNPTQLPTKNPTQSPNINPSQSPSQSPTELDISCVDEFNAIISLSFEYIVNDNDSQQQINDMISNKTKQFIEIELKRRAGNDCSLTEHSYTVKIIPISNQAMVNISTCFNCINMHILSIDNVNYNKTLEKDFISLFYDNSVLLIVEDSTVIFIDVINPQGSVVDHESTTTNFNNNFDDIRYKNELGNSVEIIVGVLIGLIVLICCFIWITVFVWKSKQKQKHNENVDNMPLQTAGIYMVKTQSNNNNKSHIINDLNQNRVILGEDDTNSDGDLNGVTADGENNKDLVMENDEELMNEINVTAGNILSEEGGLNNVDNDEIIIGNDEEDDIMTKGNEMVIDDEIIIGDVEDMMTTKGKVVE